MNHISINPQPCSDAMFFSGLPDHVTAPVITERPPIRVPRSVTRRVSHSELQTAATMMGKLRCRDDQKMLAHVPAFDGTEHAVDIAVDRLLRVI